MKLLMIIAGDEFAEDITSLLVEHNYNATNIGSSGDFLQYGYTVLMLGIANEEVDSIFKLLKGNVTDEVSCRDYHDEVTIHVIDVDNHVKKHNTENAIKTV